MKIQIANFILTIEKKDVNTDIISEVENDKGVIDMARIKKYNDVVDYAKDKYNDAANWSSENPELATALGVGIPGALLAGAGALALRRRQRNAK